VYSSGDWASGCLGKSSWMIRESKGASELSSSDPQWSGSGGGIGERGGLRVVWLLS
jgi:hypothetical protein